MESEKTFPLEIDFEGRHYKGSILPSAEKDEKGFPVFFRVEMDGRLYAYVCCGERGWHNKDEPTGHSGLINAIGSYIFDWYE